MAELAYMKGDLLTTRVYTTRITLHSVVCLSRDVCLTLVLCPLAWSLPPCIQWQFTTKVGSLQSAAQWCRPVDVSLTDGKSVARWTDGKCGTMDRREECGTMDRREVWHDGQTGRVWHDGQNGSVARWTDGKSVARWTDGKSVARWTDAVHCGSL